jgi:hypothetical protein
MIPFNPRYGMSALRMRSPVVLVGPVTTWGLRPTSAATSPGTAAVEIP